MHANTINEHESLTRTARALADAWKGTDPMTSEEDVRKALVAVDTDPEEIDDLLPYVIDACLEAGLLK